MKMTETPNSEFSDNYTNYTKLYLSITILLVNVLIQIYFIFLKWSLVRETIRFLMDPCGNPVLWGNVSVSGNAFICFSVACRCCGKDEVHRAVAMGTLQFLWICTRALFCSCLIGAWYPRNDTVWIFPPLHWEMETLQHLRWPLDGLEAEGEGRCLFPELHRH